jgi:uncharacterized lipoprotein YbaY
MKRVRGTYDGSAVVLRERVDLPPDTEVEVLIPEPEERSLATILAQSPAAGQVLSVEEVAELVHEVRAARR